jgi:hypothetical protein
MSIDPTLDHDLRELEQRLHDARVITSDLMTDVITRSCLRFQAQNPTAKAKVLDLVALNAFADATLALIELELPQWKLRRLVHDDGEWHCSFSRELGVPIELDEMAEVSHEVLPLAMLGAFVEARRHGLPAATPRPNVAPQIEARWGHVACCDNFA